jgi:hypothetical protein
MKTQKSLDAQWYRRFEELCSFEPYEYLGGQLARRAQQKKFFFEGKVENPRLDLPFLDVSTFLQKQIKLSMFEKELVEQEKNPIVKEAYILKLSEKKAEVNLLLASAERNMKAFQAYNEILYGRPSKKYYYIALSNLHETIEAHKTGEDGELKTLAQKLDQLLPWDKEESRAHDTPDERIIEAVRKVTHAELGPLIEQIPDNEHTPARKDVVDVFQQALHHVGAHDWKIQINIHDNKFNTNEEKKYITIPKHRKITNQIIRRLIFHEIGTHVKRRVMGEANRLQLLSIGLNEYQTGEEGIATVREQVAISKFIRRSRVGQYLAICLATGIDGKPRNFREVFDILETYFRYKYKRDGLFTGEEKKAAQEKAWDMCVRVFRGSTCEARGVCFTKDKIYLEGNLRMWELLQKDISVANDFSLGKYDPTKPIHMDIVNTIRMR